jgi:hypothetical protein
MSKRGRGNCGERVQIFRGFTVCIYLPFNSFASASYRSEVLSLDEILDLHGVNVIVK